MLFISVVMSVCTGKPGVNVWGWQLGVDIIFTVLVGNIPAAALLIIFFVRHEKFKKTKSIDKMNIQDLE